MVRRTYYLPADVVAELDRAITEIQADAYVDRAPSRAAVIAEVIRAGLANRSQVVESVRARTRSSSAGGVGGSTRARGWQRPVALPESLDELRGPTEGVVRLPLAVHASGAGPREEFDLSRPGMRAALYQIVLREGSVADLRRWINAHALRELWPRVWLPQYVRQAWAERFPDLAA